MVDLFSIQRGRENRRNMSREELLRDRAARAARIKKFVKLKPGLYYDPVDRVIMRKAGSQYLFLRSDRRNAPRLGKEAAEEAQFRLIAGGLFWDPAKNAVYKKTGAHYVLYSRDRRATPKDRRKKPGPSPTGTERRVQKRR